MDRQVCLRARSQETAVVREGVFVRVAEKE